MAVLICAVAGLLAGCRSAPRSMPATTAPTAPPVEVMRRPAIDLTRGGAGFPLDLTLPPKSLDELTTGLERAYAARLEGTQNIRITADGDSVTDLRSLEIDLTNSSVRPNYTPLSQVENAKYAQFMHVKKLRYVADPLKYQNYAASMVLEANDADLALTASDDKKLALALTNCSTGSARLTIDLRDLESGLAAGSRLRSTMAFGIDSIGLQLRSSTKQTLEAVLTINARVLMLPARFRLTGRADIDDQFRVHFTNLNAEGDDPAGAMVAAVVQGKLDKLNNRAAPLLKLPGDRIHIDDLQFMLDSNLRINIQFSGQK
ncbi:MAG: hypothetical protein H7144_08930 [Burkholderiales bacterium]|nr:hypothetical protein [Phycisphaerae bacterium]